METNRRKWLKQIGLVFVGVGFSGLKTIASPVTKTSYPAPDTNDNITRLSSNENPYGPSPMARRAMADSVGISNRYQWQMIRDLIEAVAAKNNVTRDNVLIGAGSIQIIDACMQFAALQKGNVIIAEPTFSRWTVAAEKSGLGKISIQLTKDKRHDLAAMLNAIKADTRMVYVFVYTEGNEEYTGSCG